jgi:hypothetical protein
MSIPNPRLMSIDAWARAVYEANVAGGGYAEETLRPVSPLLRWRMTDLIERASIAGVLLYDPAVGVPVHSDGASWVIPNQETISAGLFVTNTASTTFAASVGANRVPLPTSLSTNPVWGSFNASTYEITLLGGMYLLEGYFTLYVSSGDAVTAASYIAEASALTTPVGRGMGQMLCKAWQSQIHVPVSGTLEVPADGGTYALMASVTGASFFGAPTTITGVESKLSALTVRLTGVTQ